MASNIELADGVTITTKLRLHSTKHSKKLAQQVLRLERHIIMLAYENAQKY